MLLQTLKLPSQLVGFVFPAPKSDNVGVTATHVNSVSCPNSSLSSILSCILIHLQLAQVILLPPSQGFRVIVILAV